MLNIRPVSDLRNKFTEIEETVKRGQPVYLTKNGYGSMVVMSLEQYSALTERPTALRPKIRAATPLTRCSPV